MAIFGRGSRFDKRGFGMVASNHLDGAKQMLKGNFRQGIEQMTPGDLGHDHTGRDRGNFFKGSLGDIDRVEKMQNLRALHEGNPNVPYQNQPGFEGLSGPAGVTQAYADSFAQPNQGLTNAYQQLYKGYI